ncbi:MAG TPA: ABC transporter permease [Kofleriaceae bacterium]|nr:ABC transporter permease [Kofleriaceae bacterium]
MLALVLAGRWRVGRRVPAASRVEDELATAPTDRIIFDTTAVDAWDSALVAFAARLLTVTAHTEVTVDRTGLPAGVQRLLALAEATPARATRATKPSLSFFERVGLWSLGRHEHIGKTLEWIGLLTTAFAKFLVGRAKFRRSDLGLQMQLAGAHAIGIVSLVAALVGLILAFIAAVQLQSFGAQLYVANLVGIGVVRELGAVMAAIVVAGRTGAAFAAELGTMRVTQEIDALTTFGVSPVEYLVLPRVLAVTLMMPLLCVYADLLGVLGGAAVGIGLMHISPRIYYDQTIQAIDLADLLGGLLKAGTYGFLIGAAGCFTGLRAGRSAAAVGKATTSAVVAGIVLVIVACGIYAVVFYRLRI